MRNRSIGLIKVVAIALIALTATISAVQLRADAVDADLLLCTNTGQQCRSDSDCTRTNPTCFCANINPTTRVGICREDFGVAK